VRAVPSGTIVTESESRGGDGGAPSGRAQADEPAHLSEWSAYGSFTVYGTILSRIEATRRIRVGTNLEQNTQFGRRQSDGRPGGFDVSLIYALVEGCMRIKDHTLNLNPACQSNLEDSLRFEEKRKANPRSAADLPAWRCQSDKTAPDHPCVEFVPIRKWNAWQDALRRKDIDLFIGGVTAARARQGSGIRFTSGYLQYRSRLYIHGGESYVAGSGLSSWLTRDRKVGVIDASSNQALLHEIILVHDAGKNEAAKRESPRIDPRPPSLTFPALEAAMDRGEIDGVILDETFVNAHPDWLAVDLKSEEPEAWKNYLAHFIGERKKEEISIAVADNGPIEPQALFMRLQQVLDTSFVTKSYLPRLCKVFWDNTSGYSCGGLP
jgi:ABC-type amino acid transport substrate-binding protein